ncbi:hypothetical protein Bca4012_008834 [Brassica carinata]
MDFYENKISFVFFSLWFICFSCSFDVVKGSAEVLYMRRSAAYQAMKRYNIIVLLSEETVAHRQARALERVRICNRNTAQISIDDKDNIYMML